MCPVNSFFCSCCECLPFHSDADASAIAGLPAAAIPYGCERIEKYDNSFLCMCVCMHSHNNHRVIVSLVAYRPYTVTYTPLYRCLVYYYTIHYAFLYLFAPFVNTFFFVIVRSSNS